MNNKSYYAIIPSYILQDKSINPNSKLLYGDITALCNEKGFCWAKNEYFSERYAVSVRTIQNYLKELQKAGYIKIVLTKKNQVRHIYIQHKQVELESQYDYEDYDFEEENTGEKNCTGERTGEDMFHAGVKKSSPDGRKIFQGTGEKNCTQNNTGNITNNNTVKGVNTREEKNAVYDDISASPPSQITKVNFLDIETLINLGDWTWDKLKLCTLVWISKMTSQAISELRQVLKPYELENLKHNFENRINNCGVAVAYAVDEVFKQKDIRFRKRNFVDFLNIYLTEPAQIKSKRESEGREIRMRMDFYKG